MPHIVGEPGPSWGQNEVSQRAGLHGQQRSMSEVGSSPGKHKEGEAVQELPHVPLRACGHWAATWTRTPTPAALRAASLGGFRAGPSTLLLVRVPHGRRGAGAARPGQASALQSRLQQRTSQQLLLLFWSRFSVMARLLWTKGATC